jgi:hypothetical protein
MFLGMVLTFSIVQANDVEHGGEEHQEHSLYQHETMQKKTNHQDHSQGFKIFGVRFGILSGILTITSLLTTFTIGMLRRFGKKRLNMKFHHYAAYTTVTMACIHAVYNLVTHL